MTDSTLWTGWGCFSKHLRLLGLALGLCWALTAVAQNEDEPNTTLLGVRGLVSQAVCNLTPVWDTADSPMVVNLPALQTTLLRDTPFSPIALVPMRFGVNNTTLACLTPLLGSTGNQLVFDAGLASVAPRTGLLRNSALTRPAQNVLVQLGLIGADGVFTPLDLNQPQALNATLRLSPSNASVQLSLNLGVRYVAARFVSETYAGVDALNPGASDVTPGNVSVFLPFMVNLK